MECSICNEIKQPTRENKNPYITCDGCKQLVCLECSELGASEIRCISLQKRILEFKCRKCRNFDTITLLQNTISDKKSIIENQERTIQLLQEKITVLEKVQININPKPTYSQVLNGSVKQKLITVPPLIIKPKKTQDSKKTQEDVQQNINPKELKIGIRNIRTAKRGNILVRCSTKEETEILKSAVETSLSNEYEFEIPKMRLPKIKIVGYRGNLNDKEIEESIKNQNNWITEEDKFNVTYIKQLRKRGTSLIIAECNAMLFHKMMNIKKVNLGWERLPVYEDLEVQRCFNCQGFYHKNTTCKNKKMCYNCGGEHDGQHCQNVTKKCVNCIDANSKYKTSHDVNHAANDENCPSYKYHLDILKSKIDYNL